MALPLEPHRTGPLANVRGERVAPAQPVAIPVRLAGETGQSVDLAESFKAFTTDIKASNREVANAVNSVATQMEQVARYFGDATMAERQSRFGFGPNAAMTRQELVSAIQEGLLTTGTALVQAAQSQGLIPGGASAPAAAPTQAPAAPVAPSGPPGPYDESPASRGQVRRTTDIVGGPDTPQTGTEVWQRAQEWRQTLGGHGGKLDVGEVRQRIAGWLNKRVSNVDIGPDLVADTVSPTGFRWAAHTGKGGRFATADEVGSFQRWDKIVGGAKNVLGSLSEGEGLGGALSSIGPGAATVVGGGAIALTGANMLVNQIQNQREATAAYQRQWGGGAMEALRARAEEGVAERAFTYREKFGHLFTGGLGAGASAEAFRGITNLGIQGRSVQGGFNRGAALDFTSEMYQKLGMTVQDSLQVISAAAEQGEGSLKGLSEALVRVSEDAHAAGGNAEEARKHFLAYYQAAFAGGAGGNAATVAGALAGGQAQLGAGWQNVDMSRMLTDPRLQTLQAGALGLSRTQYLSGIMQPGQGALLQGRGIDAAQRRIREQVLGPVMQRIQPGIDELRDYVANSGGRAAPSRQMWERNIQGAIAAGLDPLLAQQIVQATTGQQMEGNEAIKLLLGQQAGFLSAEGNVIAEQTRSRTMTHSELGRNLAQAGTRQDALSEINKAIGGGAAWSPDDKKFYGKHDLGSTGTRRHQNRALYLNKYASKGIRSPQVEALLQDQDKDRRFRVETKDGPAEVDLETALKFYFDQIASGEAEITAGSGEGGTVADVTKLAEDPNAGARLGKDSATEYGKVKGAKEVGTKKKDESGDKGGRVVISLAPGLIASQVTGNVAVQEAGRNAGRAPSPTVPASSRAVAPVD